MTLTARFGLILLQWGRIHADAEGNRADNVLLYVFFGLQWGRIHADAEGVH